MIKKTKDPVETTLGDKLAVVPLGEKQVAKHPLIDNFGDKLHAPWQPGQSGNPAGRPKGKKYLSEALRELFESEPEFVKAMAKALIREAKAGNVQAFKEAADRVEGKVAGEEDMPAVAVSIVYELAKPRGGNAVIKAEE